MSAQIKVFRNPEYFVLFEVQSAILWLTFSIASFLSREAASYTVSPGLDFRSFELNTIGKSPNID
jgi:hypothetical protein